MHLTSPITDFILQVFTAFTSASVFMFFSTSLDIKTLENVAYSLCKVFQAQADCMKSVCANQFSTPDTNPHFSSHLNFDWAIITSICFDLNNFIIALGGCLEQFSCWKVNLCPSQTGFPPINIWPVSLPLVKKMISKAWMNSPPYFNVG